VKDTGRHPRWWAFLGLFPLVGALACDPPGSGLEADAARPAANAERTPQRSFDDVFTVQRSIVLEENDDVINVSPSLTPHPEGGFLVADFREHRVRRYAESGDLLWQFGREGEGPGEFGAVQAALQIPDGRIMIGELSRKVTLLDEEAQEVSEVFPTFTDGRIEELDLLADGRVLVSGRWNYANPGQGILKVVDPATGRADASFFVPQVPAFLQLGAARAGWATSDIRGDTIATMFAWSDTIHLQDLDGNVLEEIPLPPSSFVHAREHPDGFESPAVWMRQHSRFQEIEWLPDGRFLIQYGGATRGVSPQDSAARYHILLIGRQGQGLAEVLDGPRFRMIGNDGGIYFSDPDDLEASRLLVTTLKETVRP
jgi:hypothetical protein